MIEREREREIKWLFNTRVHGYKLHAYQGAFAYELQVGTLVFQWFYKESRSHIERLGRRLRVWKDPYGKN